MPEVDVGSVDSPAGDSLVTELATPAGPVRVHVWPSLDPAAARRPVLLATHGWTDSGEVFGPLAAALRFRWTVVAPDAPGHGGTPWPHADTFDVTTHAVGVTAVLDALPQVAGRRRRAVLLGHSMGAVTAARVAAARPVAVAHLVLEEPARTTPRRSPSQAGFRTWLRGLRGTDHAGRLAYVVDHHPDWPADERGPWVRSKAEVDVAHLEVPAVWGEPLMAVLADVTCPVLIIRGERARGAIVSMTAARRCAAACRGGAEVLALPAGHNPRREARGAFIAALASVLGRDEA